MVAETILLAEEKIMSDGKKGERDDTRPVGDKQQQQGGGGKQAATLEELLAGLEGEHRKAGYDKVKTAIKGMLVKKLEHQTAIDQITREMNDVFEDYKVGILPK